MQKLIIEHCTFQQVILVIFEENLLIFHVKIYSKFCFLRKKVLVQGENIAPSLISQIIGPLEKPTAHGKKPRYNQN